MAYNGKTLLLILLLISCAFHAKAQLSVLSAPYSYSRNGTPTIQELLEDIEQKTDISISYSNTVIDAGRRVQVDRELKTVGSILNFIFQGQNISIKERRNKILLIPADKSSHKINRELQATINGYVKDSSGKEVLIGAIVYIPELQTGTSTNTYGYYSLSVPVGKHNVVCSYIGYQSDTSIINLNTDTRKDILLSERSMLSEVQITAAKNDNAGYTQLSYEDIKSRPVLLGENDVMRGIQNLSGVTSGIDGTNTVLVRGGDPGQNMNLLDGVPLYYIDHFFGLTSVFNTEAIKSVDFHKGAFPARYGGRLSSVIDVSTKDGDMEHFGGQFNMGLVKGSLNVEGPIVKNKASFMLSGRRTWIDALWRPLTNAVGFDFYDINAKANYIINKNNRVFVSAYNGRDQIRGELDGGEIATRWGNTVVATKWNTIINPKLFLNTILTYSKFKYEIKDDRQEIFFGSISSSGNYKGISTVRDAAIRLQANWYPNPTHSLQFGGHYSNADFVPVQLEETGGQANVPMQLADRFHSNEVVLFAEDNIIINEKLKIRPGLHFANWFSENFNYSSIQPRLYVAYNFAPRHILYASATQMAQFLHLISNSTYGFPTDFWVPSSENLEPEESYMATVGYTGRPGKTTEYNVELYYRDIRNVTMYNAGNNIFDNTSKWDEKIVQGNGSSYGAEFSLKQKLGKFDYILAYTLSWSWRKFDQLNDGKAFPYRYDRRHNIKTALTYRPSAKFNATANWTFMSGEAITLPDQIYPDFDRNLNVGLGGGYTPTTYTYNFTEWNNYRLPAIHRLDIGINFIKQRKRSERTWSLGIFNAYGRKNIVFAELVDDEEGFNGNDFRLRGISFFRYIPYISYQLRF